MKTKQLKKIISYLNKHIKIIKKLTIENYNEKSFVYIVMPNTILNVIVSDKIVVEVDDNLNKHFANFYQERFNIESIEEFQLLFEKIIIGYKEKTKGLFITYQNNKYLCDIEISSIDKDRGMGIEKIYDINFTDKKNIERFAAQVSEYPLGIFNLVHIFDDFEITEMEIINYFYDNY
ncbi:hypothetical protein [Flavobacterium sp. 245]|uniref:hypothetical protein n=1 Tax=Flavobacterium sp. 245 TaxID=2512115 RepID=UPI00105D890A|nr:hypothetical protein [Flavobacterium sp. 245]TDO96642.1 hypothetical protein EV145_111142 [Flavobacterium sp. 245]